MSEDSLKNVGSISSFVASFDPMATADDNVDVNKDGQVFATVVVARG